MTIAILEQSQASFPFLFESIQMFSLLTDNFWLTLVFKAG